MGFMNETNSAQRYVWLPIVILALGTFTLGLTEFSMMPMLPLIADTFQVNHGVSGEAISAYALGVVIGAPLLMLLTPKMKRRSVLILYALLIFIFNGLSAGAQSFDQLIVSRFLSGLPHGAYFGTALVFVAQMAPEGRKTLLMSRVFLGLTIATIIGVPVATLMAQHLSWRWCLVCVSSLALVTSGLLYLVVPDVQFSAQTLRQEMGVLKSKILWSITGIAVIGFGGVFCIYTYLADTMLQVTQVDPVWISVAMVTFGAGSTIGAWLLGLPHDRHAIRVTGIAMVYAVFVAVMYVYAAQHLAGLLFVTFLLGACLGLTTVIQSMLMQVVQGGQEVLGALLQCAFNMANAIGPFAGSFVFKNHLPANDTGGVSALLFAGGLFMWALSLWQMKRKTVRQTQVTA